MADRGLLGQHDRVGPVEHRVRDVGDLGARRQRIRHHRHQHLRRGDHRAAGPVRGADDPLLGGRNPLDRDLDAQIAARDHDRVGGGDDRVEPLQRLLLLDLRHQRQIGQRRAPRRCRARAGRTTARRSPGDKTPMSARSARSLSVSAGSDDVSCGQVDAPCAIASVPPTRTRQATRSRRTSAATRAMRAVRDVDRIAGTHAIEQRRIGHRDAAARRARPCRRRRS